MAKKTTKTRQKPRYLTIRIQYYPVNKNLFIVLFFLFILPLGNFMGTYLRNWLPYPLATTVFAAEKFQLSYASQVGKENQSRPKDEYTHPVPTKPKNEIVSHGSRDTKTIALTFDADMTPGMKMQLHSGEVVTFNDKKVIQILTQTQTKATFFLAGMWIETYPDDTKDMAKNSLFELANHSYSHPSFDGDCFGLGEIPNDQNIAEIQKTQFLLQSSGSVNNQYFRFPGGCYSQQDIESITSEGLTVVHWDVIGHDGFNHDAQAIINNIIPHVQNGSIIVLHLGGSPNTPKTAEILPTVITELKAKGFAFVKMSELLQEENTLISSEVPPLFSTTLEH